MFVKKVLAAVERFFLTPASPRPLAVFRIGLALVLLAQGLAFAGNLLQLYGQAGIVQWQVDPVGKPALAPGLDRLTAWLSPLGLSADQIVCGVFLAYFAALTCLLIGWKTRLAAVGVWLSHLALLSSGNSTYYGVDDFANIALFYCVWMPVGAVWSVDARGEEVKTPEAGLSIRVLQIHLCIVYLASGLEKASGEQWWNGEALWRAVMREDFAVFDLSWLAEVSWLAKLACWGTLAVEIGYVFLIWPQRTRRLWLPAIVGMHLGIGLFLGLGSFAALMIVFNVSAFGACLLGGTLRGMLGGMLLRMLPAHSEAPAPTAKACSA